jgi:putative acetyltransferase
LNNPLIRPTRDDDAQDLIGLITLCFAEYPGCVFDPHDDMPDIIRPTQSRLAREGQFMVVEDARGRVAACIGVDFPHSQTAELHRLYVRQDVRGLGLATILTERMEHFARERGARRMILWTDTRFSGEKRPGRSVISRAAVNFSLKRRFVKLQKHCIKVERPSTVVNPSEWR